MSKIFGERLSNLLKESNITQKELAMIIGINEATISRYINGEREPKPKTIANIATILNTSSDYLLGIEENETKDNIDYPYIKKIIARNVNNLTENEKKELITVILDHIGNKGDN